MRALVLLIFLSTGHAAEPLSREEWKLEAAFLAATLIDYRQTLDIKNHNGERYEQNIILGKYPSDARIRNYFAVVAVGHIAVTHLLPKSYRPAWQWGTLGLQIGVIAHNHSIGLRLDF